MYKKDTFDPIDLSSLKTYSIAGRKSKVSVKHLAKPWTKGNLFSAFMDYLPDILAAHQLREVIDALVCASRNKKTIIMGMGAHVIKVGLAPVIVDLIKRGVIQAVALNGAGIIHDFELAYAGKTSEDVASSLETGEFGMAKETGQFLNQAIDRSDLDITGLGKAVGNLILEHRLPFSDISILAAAAKYHIPVTVHVAFGTDIIHMHPAFDPAKAGAATHRDFRIFSSVVSTLENGVYMNVGSAVMLPEVFLKALTLVRNLGHQVKNFTTVNMDFITHYRPITNVVRRPVLSGGKGYNLIGCHEIMLPLIAAGVIEKLDDH
ncbi:MAG: hypothetical protein R6U27_13220 [Desulfobacterales bacterium]